MVIITYKLFDEIFSRFSHFSFSVPMDAISMTTIILLFSCIYSQINAVHVMCKSSDTKNMSILWFNFENSNTDDIMWLIHSTFWPINFLSLAYVMKTKNFVAHRQLHVHPINIASNNAMQCHINLKKLKALKSSNSSPNLLVIR